MSDSRRSDSPGNILRLIFTFGVGGYLIFGRAHYRGGKSHLLSEKYFTMIIATW